MEMKAKANGVDSNENAGRSGGKRSNESEGGQRRNACGGRLIWRNQRLKASVAMKMAGLLGTAKA